MNFLASLLGKESHQTKIWNIKLPSEHPAYRTPQPLPVANTDKTAAPDQAQGKKDADPFLVDPLLDTIALKTDLGSEADNAYSKHPWANAPESETRKLRAIQNRHGYSKPTSDDFDPNDPGKMRRNWKR